MAGCAKSENMACLHIKVVPDKYSRETFWEFTLNTGNQVNSKKIGLVKSCLIAHIIVFCYPD